MSHFITVINSCKSSLLNERIHMYINTQIEWMNQSFFDTSKIIYIYIYICTYVWIWWILSRVYLLRKTRKKTLFPRLRYCLRVFDFRREISTIAEMFDQGTGSVNFTRASFLSVHLFLYRVAHVHRRYLDSFCLVIKNA